MQKQDEKSELEVNDLPTDADPTGGDNAAVLATSFDNLRFRSVASSVYDIQSAPLLVGGITVTG
jgi:hypothetical protein